MTANWLIPAALSGIPKDRRSRHAWRDLLEQLQPFPAHVVFGSHETGGVAAGPRQAVDEASGDRITGDREHDRHGAGRLQQRPHGRAAMGQDDVRRKRGQFRRMSANLGGIGRGPADVDAHVAADRPVRLLQPLQERSDAGLIFWIVRGCGQQHADPTHPLALLRARRERPRDRSAECCDEFSPLHSITSSARASTDGGMVRPSAFAVLRLMTSSYLVGACTGRSAGFSPLRMRST